MKLYYVNWYDGNYINGIVFGFKSREEAERWIAENKHKDNDITEWDGELLDIYTGE